jgi:hypothetical protein
MNRPLRRRHLWMVAILGVIALAVLALAQAGRRPIPPTSLPSPGVTR